LGSSNLPPFTFGLVHLVYKEDAKTVRQSSPPRALKPLSLRDDRSVERASPLGHVRVLPRIWILLPPRIPRRSFSEKSTANCRVLPEITKITQSQPEVVRRQVEGHSNCSTVESGRTQFDIPVFPNLQIQPSFDVRCNPWLNRTCDLLWEIPPPLA